jgi:hypothetical protein
MTTPPDGSTPVDGSAPTLESINWAKDTAKDPEDEQLDPESFRVDQSLLDQPVAKTLLTTISIRRPEPLEFFRIRSGEDFRMGPVPFINLKQNREYYLVKQKVLPYLQAREYWYGTIFLATNRLDKPFFWIVTTQSPTGRVSDWYLSALECADRAQEHWVQLISDRDAGGYTVALAQDCLPDPVWPEQTFKELFKIGFKRRIVDSLEHQVFKQLRGIL